MPTVRRPSSWAVRKTRMAISLRLATRSLRMGRGGCRGASSGMVAVLDVIGATGNHDERVYPRECQDGMLAPREGSNRRASSKNVARGHAEIDSRKAGIPYPQLKLRHQ